MLPLLGDVLSTFALPQHHPCLSSAQVLKWEVELMAKMAKTIDSFTQNQTRLVVIIDGLDACEQDKVLQMLDTVCPRLLVSLTERAHAPQGP